MNTRAASIAVVILRSVVLASSAVARDLTFEERVNAQEAIERVYYSLGLSFACGEGSLGTTSTEQQRINASPGACH